MKTEQTFKTKTGFCHITEDKIILTRDGIIGNVAELTTGKSIYRILGIYGIMAIFLLYMAYTKIVKEDWIEFAVYCGIGIYLVYSLIKSINLSATPIIERNKIKSVEFKPAKKFLTRSYFKVNFKQNDGKIKSRLIMLPGSLTDGTSETEKAIGIMKNAGLIKNNVG
ncbi:phosphoribosylaminoimidazolesuccinocarboxamide synthase [uncultured Formosa sp.]|uniref:phosphoribosylaminoimidazolesuccinocarboxamide synthase n=1 Tax=uncultured Formosa sp. TaxID=255435 RepID=UPI00262ABB01|nr:phosphoribosylaminoimidazolesuccinocarboxamide synthase [uncultured Formosa sp.]